MPTKNFRHVRKTSVVKTPDGGRIKLGSYRPDKKNPNDKTFKSKHFSADNLPTKVDLRPYMTPVENQGDSNSCTANAMAGAYEYLSKRLNDQEHHVSRLFIYYNARELDGDPDKDEGTYLRSCVKVLKKYGTCSEQTWPFDLHRIYTSPEEKAYNEAAGFVVEDAYRVNVDLDSMRSCLAEGYPFTFGLELFSSFQKTGSNGLVPMPDPDDDQHDGGHAMLCVGYSDADKVFIVRNSWSDQWGDRGYCYIPYDYMTNPDLNGDLWAIRQVSATNVDLSQNIQGAHASLFDSATAAIATTLQVPGAASKSEYFSNYSVEYESQSVYVDGQFVSIDEYDELDALYYLEYEDEYEEFTLTEESESIEYSEEYSEETESSYEEYSEESEETEEFEDSEETEDSYEEDEEEDSDDDEDSEETEASYDEEDEEEDEEDSDEEDEDSEETEDSYDEEDEDSEDDESDESEGDDDESEDEGYEDTEASYDEGGDDGGDEGGDYEDEE